MFNYIILKVVAVDVRAEHIISGLKQCSNSGEIKDTFYLKKIK